MSNFSMHQNHVEGCSKYILLGLTFRISDTDLGWCFNSHCNKFPGDTDDSQGLVCIILRISYKLFSDKRNINLPPKSIRSNIDLH